MEKQDNRSFDWGPPPRKTESFKTFLMYFFIGFVLFGGIYCLLDIGDKPSFVAVDNGLNYSADSAAALKKSNLGSRENINLQKSPSENAVIPKKESTFKPSEPPKIEITYGNGVFTEASDQFETKTAEIPPKSDFYVQMGAFHDEESALKIFSLLENQIGINPVLKRPDENHEAFRILIGPYASEAEADFKAEKLNENDMPCFVVEQ